jgi:hypothetical protein
MSKSEGTKWRLGVKPEEAEESKAELSSEEDEKKEELQQTIQAKAEETGRGEGEEPIITEPPKKKEQKAKGPSLKKRESDSSKSMANISKQVEGQANQLIRIEKAIVSLQKLMSKIDKQSNTIKQLYGMITKLQRQVRSSKNQKQNKGLKRKKQER